MQAWFDQGPVTGRTPRLPRSHPSFICEYFADIRKAAELPYGRFSGRGCHCSDSLIPSFRSQSPFRLGEVSILTRPTRKLAVAANKCSTASSLSSPFRRECIPTSTWLLLSMQTAKKSRCRSHVQKSVQVPFHYRTTGQLHWRLSRLA